MGEAKSREAYLAEIAAARVAVPPAMRRALQDLALHMRSVPDLDLPGPGKVDELQQVLATLLQETQSMHAMTGQVSKAPLIALFRYSYMLGVCYGIWPGNWDFNDPELGLPEELRKQKP